ncbi:MAG TPA: ABC transporter permease [Rhizobacter sp.]|nr:ABC transporter permease [Rhizobacter sp.]
MASRPSFVAGYLIVSLVLATGLLAPWLAPHSPVDSDAGAYLLPPSWAHPMGTDAAGLDVLSRVLFAPRVDLLIALLSTGLAAAVGGAIGAALGLWEGRGGLRGALAATAMRVADVVQAFPVFALALVLVAVLGQGVLSIVLATGIVNVPVFLRVMRTQVLALRGQPFVESAVVSGASDFYLLHRHLIPNAIAPLLAQMAINIGAAVLLTAGLSFLGAGVRAPTPEWGSMIAMGFANVVTGQWWPSLFPGAALALTLLGFGLVGNSIEAYADPRQRTRPSPAAWRRFIAARSAPAA